MNKTLVIIGKSPIVDRYDLEIKELLKKYDTMAINSVSTKYETKYCTFLDTSIKYYVKNIPESVKFITAPINFGFCKGHETEIFKSYKYKEGPVYKDNALSYFGFTHDYAIAWAIKKGYKNVVLVGAADFDTDTYCSSIRFSMPKFKISPFVEKASIDGISNIYSNLINVYTINPLSKLNVNKISISDLLYNAENLY